MFDQNDENSKKQINVFIVGLRGYGKNYGGWETLANGLFDNWKNKNVKFYAFEKVSESSDAVTREINNVTCIGILEKEKGSSAMMKYDAKSSEYAYKYIIDNKIPNPIIYFLGVRIGPYLFLKKRKYKKAGIILLENPAGLEWRRTKWGKLVQVYLAIAAYFMAISVDYLICDSKAILDYYSKIIKSKVPKKFYISYGSYLPSRMELRYPEKVNHFFKKWNIKREEYFLILGRFVPENNYEMMFNGFRMSNTNHKLLVITNYKSELPKFHKRIIKNTDYKNDDRIIMAGTVYDKELLNYIRQNAICYIHGHSVGGTNPGLLEALSATKVNLLYDVPFNREVGRDSALYFKDKNSLAQQLNVIENMSLSEKKEYGNKTTKIIKDNYSWDLIVNEYDKLFNQIYKIKTKNKEKVE